MVKSSVKAVSENYILILDDSSNYLNLQAKHQKLLLSSGPFEDSVYLN